MGDGLALLLSLLPAWVLHLARTGAFVFSSDLFGRQGDSKWPRIVLSVAFATTFWLLGDKTVAVDRAPQLAALCGQEVLVGLMLGWCVRLLTGLLLLAGEVLGHEMGFTMAEVLDPVSGRSAQVMGQLLQAVGMLAILTLDLHHDVIRALAASYDHVPVGRGMLDVAPVVGRMGEMIAVAIEVALRWAFPVMATSLVLTGVLALLSRAVPNINLLEFSFGLRVLLSLAASMLLLADGLPALVDSWHGFLSAMSRLFEGA